MVRGINKQNIFLDDDDYMCMMRVLADAKFSKSPSGKIISSNECQILAFALMPNHAHILVKEGKLGISEIMKKIQDRYVWFYNMKYDRCGHLFQDRFRSEPVDDDGYLLTLMRYIHRNPVKGMLCDLPEQYLYSSWREYINDGRDALVKVCDVVFVRSKFIEYDLEAFVNQNVNDDCMDMDKERFVLTDRHAWAIIQDISNADNPEDFKQYNPEVQFKVIQEAITRGVTIRQCSRLSSLTYSMIRRKLDLHSHQNVNQGVRPPESVSIRKLEEMDPLERVMTLLMEDCEMKQHVMAERAQLSSYAIRKVIQSLVKTGKICPVDGKRWAWKIIEEN